MSELRYMGRMAIEQVQVAGNIRQIQKAYEFRRDLYRTVFLK